MNEEHIRPGPDDVGQKNRPGAGYTKANKGPTKKLSFGNGQLLAGRHIVSLQHPVNRICPFVHAHHAQGARWPQI